MIKYENYKLTEKGRAHLVQLIATIKAADPEAFDMDNWLEHDENSLASVDRPHGSSHDQHCGTTACIAGWSWIIGEGKKEPGEIIRPFNQWADSYGPNLDVDSKGYPELALELMDFPLMRAIVDFQLAQSPEDEWLQGLAADMNSMLPVDHEKLYGQRGNFLDDFWLFFWSQWPMWAHHAECGKFESDPDINRKLALLLLEGIVQQGHWGRPEKPKKLAKRLRELM